MLPWQRTIIDRETSTLARAVDRWARETAGRHRDEVTAKVLAQVLAQLSRR